MDIIDEEHKVKEKKQSKDQKSHEPQDGQEDYQQV
jgi:hypothetical protein